MIYEESSFRAIYNYKLLCKIKDQNDKSLCEAADQSMLTNIVKDVFLDSPSSCKYNFNHNPPILDGQNGVPLIVDELLGKSIVQPTQFSMSYLMLQNQSMNVISYFSRRFQAKWIFRRDRRTWRWRVLKYFIFWNQ